MRLRVITVTGQPSPQVTHPTCQREEEALYQFSAFCALAANFFQLLEKI